MTLPIFCCKSEPDIYQLSVCRQFKYNARPLAPPHRADVLFCSRLPMPQGLMPTQPASCARPMSPPTPLPWVLPVGADTRSTHMPVHHSLPEVIVLLRPIAPTYKRPSRAERRMFRHALCRIDETQVATLRSRFIAQNGDFLLPRNYADHPHKWMAVAMGVRLCRLCGAEHVCFRGQCEVPAAIPKTIARAAARAKPIFIFRR